LIRKVSDGYVSLGNASLFEHRSAVSVLGYAPLIQGILMRLFGLSIATITLVGDIVFPWLAGILLFLLVRRIKLSRFAVFFGAVILFSSKGENWLRLINPQITGVLFLMGVLGFSLPTVGGRMLRACVTAALLLTQPVYAALFLLIEGILFCVDWRHHGLKASLQDRVAFISLVAAAALLRILLALGTADPLSLADTYRRLGLTPTHLPAAPALQLTVLAVLLVHVFSVWKSKSNERLDLVVLPAFLLASLAALSQSILLGVDGNFGLYYAFPVNFLLWMCMLRDLRLLVPVSLRTAVLGVLAVFVFAGFFGQMLPMIANSSSSASVMEEALTELLPFDEAVRIVAAPLEVSNMLPALTQHFVLFSQYARFQDARDEELAQRFLTLHRLFPLDPSVLLEGHPLVFGLYAGNLSARTRTWCKITRFVGVTNAPCDQRLEDFIYHQDVLRFLREGKIDVIQMLRNYHVDTVITEKALPSMLLPFCTLSRSAASYRRYDCNFDR